MNGSISIARYQPSWLQLQLFSTAHHPHHHVTTKPNKSTLANPSPGKVINQQGNFINVNPELNPFKSDPFTTRPTTVRPRPNNNQRPNNQNNQLVVEEFPVNNNNNNNNQFNDPFNQPLSFGQRPASNENVDSDVFNPFGVDLESNSDQVCHNFNWSVYKIISILML